MVSSMYCIITLFIITIVEFHVLIYDDFVCYWSLTFCAFFFICNCFYNIVALALQFYTANVLLTQHNR